jgi:hypothetical protein
VLSACHVLALAGNAQVGDVIVEPGRPHAAASPFAVLADFEPLKNDDTINPYDAAIARLHNKTDVTANIPQIGIKPDPVEAVEYQSVRKYGAGTGQTLGVVTAVRSRARLELGTDSFLFDNVIKVVGAGRPFSVGGDSGAVVVDAQTRRPVGLIIGGDYMATYLSPIGPVLQRFGARLVGQP